MATFDYGMKNRDPLNLLRTYRKHEDPPKAHPLTPEEVCKYSIIIIIIIIIRHQECFQDNLKRKEFVYTVKICLN